ncbi:hypothetical protein CHARACLAT_004154 [Characodon lateralis]|uniref:Uncharacterized protein n=1 Tax=Characodon lateralis TaxID=208331 RepID=A0ABU7EQS1_9TELE|nr:hypothetical protein [Characodon lateralis]
MNSVDPASNKLLTFNQRSASEDLGCRRGDFSRKHYGSVELVSPTLNAPNSMWLPLLLSMKAPLFPFISSFLL